jgi:hypothetical protein
MSAVSPKHYSAANPRGHTLLSKWKTWHLCLLLFVPPAIGFACYVYFSNVAVPIQHGIGRCIVCGAPATRSLGGQVADRTYVLVGVGAGTRTVMHPYFYCERHEPSFSNRLNYNGNVSGNQGIELTLFVLGWIAGLGGLAMTVEWVTDKVRGAK